LAQPKGEATVVDPPLLGGRHTLIEAWGRIPSVSKKDESDITARVEAATRRDGLAGALNPMDMGLMQKQKLALSWTAGDIEFTLPRNLNDIGEARTSQGRPSAAFFCRRPWSVSWRKNNAAVAASGLVRGSASACQFSQYREGDPWV